MAIEVTGIIDSSGIAVASPASPHGTHVLRSAINFNRVINGLSQLVIDHADLLGDIRYIKEWWEDPAIVGETEEFPCFYVLPLYLDEDKTKKNRIYYSEQFIGDPLALSTFPTTVMCYYKYLDVRKPLSAVRGYAWNFWDILSQDKYDYALPGGVQAMTPHMGWHLAGTTYIIQWWSLELKLQAIL